MKLTCTSEVSACASTSGAGQARIYKELGYDGIIVTDHFITVTQQYLGIYHGNLGENFTRFMKMQKRRR